MYQRYLFFKNHAGGVGRIDANGRTAWEHARVGLDLARAEVLLEAAIEADVATLEWRDDPEPWDEGTETSAEEAAAMFASNTWTGPFGAVLKIEDEHVASLWGIVVGPRGTDDPYCRVVAAELASEAEDELRQALGDARDADISTPLS